MNQADTARFWSKVQKADGCWPWKFTRKASRRPGRAMFGCEGISDQSARIMWRLVNGPIPDGLHVLHTCDNPECVNPSHLYLGNNSDNQLDRWNKDRHKA